MRSGPDQHYQPKKHASFMQCMHPLSAFFGTGHFRKLTFFDLGWHPNLWVLAAIRQPHMGLRCWVEFKWPRRTVSATGRRFVNHKGFSGWFVGQAVGKQVLCSRNWTLSFWMRVWWQRPRLAGGSGGLKSCTRKPIGRFKTGMLQLLGWAG